MNINHMNINHMCQGLLLAHNRPNTFPWIVLYEKRTSHFRFTLDSLADDAHKRLNNLSELKLEKCRTSTD